MRSSTRSQHEYMRIMNDDLLPIVYRRCNADEA